MLMNIMLNPYFYILNILIRHEKGRFESTSFFIKLDLVHETCLQLFPFGQSMQNFMDSNNCIDMILSFRFTLER